MNEDQTLMKLIFHRRTALAFILSANNVRWLHHQSSNVIMCITLNCFVLFVFVLFFKKKHVQQKQQVLCVILMSTLWRLFLKWGHGSQPADRSVMIHHIVQHSKTNLLLQHIVCDISPEGPAGPLWCGSERSSHCWVTALRSHSEWQRRADAITAWYSHGALAVWQSIWGQIFHTFQGIWQQILRSEWRNNAGHKRTPNITCLGCWAL